MTQKIAYYHLMAGLPGCMPDSHNFFAWSTRRDMARGINYELDNFGFPMRARRQINLVEAWRYIQSGGARGHFILRDIHQANQLEFVQIDAAAYHAAMKEECF